MDENKSQPTGSLRKFVFLPLAIGFLGIGILGAVLPVLPTTPFLLLASYFLARSSPKMNQRLLQSRFLGPILSDWQTRGGIRTDVKVRAILLVVVVVGATLALAKLPTPLLGIVASLALVGVWVIYRLPDLPKTLDLATDPNENNVISSELLPNIDSLAHHEQGEGHRHDAQRQQTPNRNA